MSFCRGQEMGVIMGIALLVVFVQAAAGFLTLDMFFRYIPIEPVRLKATLAQCMRAYTGIASLACLVGAWVQWRAWGLPGLAAAALNWLPWWLLWRFGLRKQFTYLYKSDGGRPVDTKKPDP
jgi:hypothetical protein